MASGQLIDVSGGVSNQRAARIAGRASQNPDTENLKILQGTLFSDEAADDLKLLFRVDGLTQSVPNPALEQQEQAVQVLSAQIAGIQPIPRTADNRFTDIYQSRNGIAETRVTRDRLFRHFSDSVELAEPVILVLLNAVSRKLKPPSGNLYREFWNPVLRNALTQKLVDWEVKFNELNNNNNVLDFPFNVPDFTKWSDETRRQWENIAADFPYDVMPVTAQFVKFILGKLYDEILHYTRIETAIQNADDVTADLMRDDLQNSKEIIDDLTSFVGTFDDPRIFVWTISLLKITADNRELTQNVNTPEEITAKNRMSTVILRNFRSNAVADFHYNILVPLLSADAVNLFFEQNNNGDFVLKSQKYSLLHNFLNDQLRDAINRALRQEYATGLERLLKSLNGFLNNAMFMQHLDVISLLIDETSQGIQAVQPGMMDEEVRKIRASQEALRLIRGFVHYAWEVKKQTPSMPSSTSHVNKIWESSLWGDSESVFTRSDGLFVSRAALKDQDLILQKMRDAIRASFLTTFSSAATRKAVNTDEMSRIAYNNLSWFMAWPAFITQYLELMAGEPADSDKAAMVKRMRLEVQRSRLQSEISKISPYVQEPATYVGVVNDGGYTADNRTLTVRVQDERTTQNTFNVYQLDNFNRSYKYEWKVRQVMVPNLSLRFGVYPFLQKNPASRYVEKTISDTPPLHSVVSSITVNEREIGHGMVWCEVSSNDNARPVPNTIFMKSAVATFRLRAVCQRTQRQYLPYDASSKENKFGAAHWTANGIPYKGKCSYLTRDPTPYYALIGMRGSAVDSAQAVIDFDNVHALILKERNDLLDFLANNPNTRRDMMQRCGERRRQLNLPPFLFSENTLQQANTPESMELFLTYGFPLDQLEVDMQTAREFLETNNPQLKRLFILQDIYNFSQHIEPGLAEHAKHMTIEDMVMKRLKFGSISTLPEGKSLRRFPKLNTIDKREVLRNLKL